MRYRTKAFEIDAILWDGSNTAKVKEFVGLRNDLEEGFLTADEVSGVIDTDALVWDYLHDTWVGVHVGNYIIRGMKGECYPCDAEVFEAKYEPAEEGLELDVYQLANPIRTVITTDTVGGGISQPEQNKRFK